MEQEFIIELRKVDIYQSESLVLQDVNFCVSRDEFVFIIGKVGSGKTSLIQTLYGELPLKQGEAYVAGFKLHKIKRRHIPYLRRKIGIVFQDFQLLTDRNIYENLRFVLRATGWRKRNEINNRINEVLERTKLLDKIYKMPHQLSGGEQQRVVIARALLNNPDIILADEPTGNLDPETYSEIMELLFEISRTGRAVVMATHNYSLIEQFKARTVKCENKKIFEINK